VDLDDVTSELYALAPGDFTARRTALAARARDESHKDLAQEIARLRRPTVSAWLVNQLVRGEAGADEDVEELESVGGELREAQARLDGPRMKELARRRQQLVASLVRRAEQVAGDDGQKVSTAVQRELEETFGAAVADEEACRAVTSGRLTRALAYAGLGEVDLTAATATALTGPVRRPRAGKAGASPAPGSPRSPGSGDSRGAQAAGTQASGASRTAEASGVSRAEASRVSRAEASRTAEAVRTAEAERLAEALRGAEADERAAQADLDAATRRHDEVLAEEARLSATLDDLQREIVRTRHELDGVTRGRAAAERDLKRRDRELEAARRARRQAEQARDRLEPGRDQPSR
jgi:hypothetical protein